MARKKAKPYSLSVVLRKREALAFEHFIAVAKARAVELRLCGLHGAAAKIAKLIRGK